MYCRLRNQRFESPAPHVVELKKCFCTYQRNHLVAILPSSSSLSLGLCCPFFDRRTSNIVAFSSLIGEFLVSSSGGDYHFWGPSLGHGFSCSSFSRCLVNLLTPSFSIFSSLLKVKISKVKFFVSWKSYTLDHVLRKLMGLLVSQFCILCWQEANDWDHVFGSCDYASSAWSCFFQGFSFHLARPRGYSFLIEELMLHLSFRDEGHFCNSLWL